MGKFTGVENRAKNTLKYDSSLSLAATDDLMLPPAVLEESGGDKVIARLDGGGEYDDFYFTDSMVIVWQNGSIESFKYEECKGLFGPRDKRSAILQVHLSDRILKLKSRSPFLLLTFLGRVLGDIEKERGLDLNVAGGTWEDEGTDPKS